MINIKNWILPMVADGSTMSSSKSGLVVVGTFVVVVTTGAAVGLTITCWVSDGDSAGQV